MENLFSYISVREVSDILEVSEATVLNWTNSGLLFTNEKNLYNLHEVYNLKQEIKSGKIQRLNSRRNKLHTTQKITLKKYLNNTDSNELVTKIISSLTSNIGDDDIVIILAEYALKSYDLIINKNSYIDEIKLLNIKNNSFYRFVLDFVQNMSLSNNIEYLIDKNYRSLLFDPIIIEDDFLGLLYQSLVKSKSKKRTGSYYTPTKVVDTMVDDILPLDKTKKIIDPCCGSGNFLINFLSKGVPYNNLYGYDIDDVSVFLTRTSIYLMSNDLEESLNTIIDNIKVQDSLMLKNNKVKNYFDVCIGNPPWGADIDLETQKFVSLNYSLINGKAVDSFSLFIELSLDLLKYNGIFSFIVPETITNVKSHANVRSLMMNSLSMKNLIYWGNIFEGVLAPAISFNSVVTNNEFAKDVSVTFEGNNFNILNRQMNADLWEFNIKDEEKVLLENLLKRGEVKTLKNNSEFALGLVTGNNKKYLTNIKTERNMPIIRGSHIRKFRITEVDNFIEYTPDKFQQVPRNELYFANEKLVYRFISDTLVFSYDNTKILTLNSANILVPSIDGLSIKYVLAILNSKIAHFYFIKKFNSVKILRNHIESIPLKIPSAEQQDEVIDLVNRIEKANNESIIIELYHKLNFIIYKIYNLSTLEIELIEKSLPKNLFL